MDNIIENHCPVLDNYKNWVNINLRTASQRPIFPIVESSLKLLFGSVIRNHAQENCSYCSSIIEKGEIRLFYTFGSRIRFA